MYTITAIDVERPSEDGLDTQVDQLETLSLVLALHYADDWDSAGYYVQVEFGSELKSLAWLRNEEG